MKPILFNAEMVRAVIDGSKTATRRLIKFPLNEYTEEIPKADKVRISGNYRGERIIFSEAPHFCFSVNKPIRRGDILYVREAWRLSNPRGDYQHGTRQADLEYKADGDVRVVTIPREWEKYLGNKWHPSIHMPKEMARVWINVTEVNVERIQDISPEQLRKEGIRIFITPKECESQFDKFGAIHDFEGKKKEFEQLWNSTIKGKEQESSKWEANPWVWAIEFVRCDKEGKELDCPA